MRAVSAFGVCGAKAISPCAPWSGSWRSTGKSMTISDLMMEVYQLQKRHPDAGGFRIWSLRGKSDISVRTVERIMALNRQIYDDIRSDDGGVPAAKTPS